MMEYRHFKGQWNIDIILDHLIYSNNQDTNVQDIDKKGIFVEIGAWDGVELSNTYHLEKLRDWNGILVEPLSEQCQLAIQNRWCKLFNGCISNYNGYIDFQKINGYSAMISGIKNGYHSIFKNRIDKEIQDHKQTISIQRIPCITINALFDSFGLEKADYMSLDTVTSEYEILKAYDCKKHPIKIISIDYNGINEKELNEWFTTNGYVLYWKCSNSDERIFINPQLKFSWELIESL